MAIKTHTFFIIGGFKNAQQYLFTKSYRMFNNRNTRIIAQICYFYRLYDERIQANTKKVRAVCYEILHKRAHQRHDTIFQYRILIFYHHPVGGTFSMVKHWRTYSFILDFHSSRIGAFRKIYGVSIDKTLNTATRNQFQRSIQNYRKSFPISER